MLRVTGISRLLLCSTLMVLRLYASVLDNQSEYDEEDSYTTPLFARVLVPEEKRDEGYNRWSSVNGQACKISDCLSDHAEPPHGFSTAPNGKFQDTCGDDEFKYVWCPTDALPQSCEWRGSGSCHGQCHEGEVTLTHSPRGDQTCARPGQQAFCCVSSTWSPYVDKCGWANGCDDCPSDAQYSVNTRSHRKGLFGSCKQNFCCPYNFQNCHWVGKGTCDDNECSATDVQVALDPSGDTGSLCAGGFSSRQKPLCCNTPGDLNPFLPVPLENLFPTLPPSEDIPAFEHQSLSYTPGLVGDNPNVEAFFFIVIDGPPGTVANLNKRDGSHLEFIAKGVHHGQAPQTAHFVCMDDSTESNCEDVHDDGLEGTAIRMPDDMGFAQWAVAHSIKESHLGVPESVAKRAPRVTKVYELEYSYDFSKVKRDSGPVYIRIDYSDSDTYYTDVVEAPHQKRNLKPRFWSTISSVWTTIIGRIRGQQYDPVSQPTLSMDNFNILIYGNDGREKGCDGLDGFLKLVLGGSMRNVMRFGYTLVGTIQPFALEEAYGYFDSDLYMSGTLSFDGKGVLDIDNGAGVARKLLSNPIVNYQASHPGIVSFSPELNAEVSLLGSGQIDGRFNVSFETGSSKTITTNAPPGLGGFGGDAIGNTVSGAATGFLTVDDPSNKTVFAMNLNLETTMNMKIFGYESPLQDTGATFAARTPHALRVVGDTGGGKPGIVDAPQQATADVIQSGTVQDGWDDGNTYPIGSVPDPVIVFEGEMTPDGSRDLPQIQDYALFGDRDFMSCSSKLRNVTLTCTYDLGKDDPSLDLADALNKLRLRQLTRDDLEPLTDQEAALYDTTLEKRAGGPSGGSSNAYKIFEYPENTNGATEYFLFTTPTYPNGNDGAALDAENGRSERYALANPNDCEDTSITANGVPGVNYDHVDSEHPEDRSIFPAHFANFAQSGQLDMADGTVHTTNLPLFNFDDIADYFAHDYADWVPQTVEPMPPRGSAAGDVADAMGSTTNPDAMVNLERGLNILKGRLYTTEGQPTDNGPWSAWMNNPSQASAESALSSLRAVFAVFNYMNAIANDRQTVETDMMAALTQFDNLYARTFPNRPERLASLRREFHQLWLLRVTNYANRYVTGRLNEMQRLYQPLAQQAGPMRQVARNVVRMIANMRARMANELHF